ncbi:MAG: hypothetical protein R2720_12285 [Candidatus Nanopelagicales bacterium]
MVISPQVILFVLFMLTVVAAIRLDEARQHRRGSALTAATHGPHRARHR